MLTFDYNNRQLKTIMLSRILKCFGVFLLLATLTAQILVAQDQPSTAPDSYYETDQASNNQDTNAGQVGGEDSGEDVVAGILLLVMLIGLVLICAIIFFLPTIIAFFRQHRNRWVILLINLFFGGTGIGWLACLIWSFNKIDDPVKGGYKIDGQEHDPIV